MLMFFDVILSVLLLWVVVTDWQRMEITNRCVLAVGVLGLIKLISTLFMGASFTLLGFQLLAVLIVFSVGFTLFWLGLMGGGDVKLLTALGIYLSFSQLPLFLVIMSVTGGFLGLVALILHRKPKFIPQAFKPPSWLGCLKAGQSVVAYGLAIVPAALWVIWAA
jgi:prepilin peptidase CpaA